MENSALSLQLTEDELRKATGMEIDEGNFYDPLAKDLDNDEC